MHPFLLQWMAPWGLVSIPSFGVMLALGLLFGGAVMAWRAPKLGLTADAIWQWLPWVMLGAIVGAKGLYCLYEWDRFVLSPLPLLLYPGGLVWYGGVAGALAVLGLAAQQQQVSFLTLTDVFSPGALVGLAFGRVGCLLSGCCYGGVVNASALPATLQWLTATAIVYPLGHVSHPWPVYPAPIFESVGALLLLGVLLVWEKRFPQLLQPTGRWSAAFLVGYGFLRFGLEFIRGDRLVLPWLGLGLSASQWMSLAGIGIGLCLWTLSQPRTSPHSAPLTNT
ncbi:MAG: prolipoprotein diacylglyceryl transferase [Vampirovibrionales bacterium]|nr:prolipoprotein diacylglyceryl transferase [Vampirovibrionales bacterium]